MNFGKNKIQIILENNNRINRYKSTIRENINKYYIEDMVIGFDEDAFELTEGYFVSEKEYDDLDMALENIDFDSNIIRIIENDRFEVGRFYSSIINCPEEGEIFDIKYLQILG